MGEPKRLWDLSEAADFRDWAAEVAEDVLNEFGDCKFGANDLYEASSAEEASRALVEALASALRARVPVLYEPARRTKLLSGLVPHRLLLSADFDEGMGALSDAEGLIGHFVRVGGLSSSDPALPEVSAVLREVWEASGREDYRKVMSAYADLTEVWTRTDGYEPPDDEP